MFNITQHNFPGARVAVSTLDAFFGRLLAAAPGLDLPVLTGEIGDSWIYGAQNGVGLPCTAYFDPGSLGLRTGPRW